MKKSKKSLLIPALSVLLLVAAAAAGTIITFLRPLFDVDKVYEAWDTIQNQFETLEAARADENGFVAPDDLPALLDELEERAASYMDQGLITEYTREDTGIFMRLSGGVGYLYSPQLEDVMSGSSVRTVSNTAGLSDDPIANTSNILWTDRGDWRGQILTIEPYTTDYGMLGNYLLGGRSPDKSAAQIARSLSDYYTFSEDDNWDSFTYEHGARLGNHSVIVWYGHGDYISKYGPVLGSSLKNNKENIAKYDRQLFGAYDRAEMVITGDYISLTPYYFEDKIPDDSLNGSLIYLANCSSARDDRLVQVFIDKGAKLVVGNSYTINTRYNLYMMTDFLSALTEQYEDGTYKTAEDALAYAKSANGDQDGVIFSYGAQVLLTYAPGESSYRLVPTPEEMADQMLLPETDTQQDLSDLSPAERYLEENIRPLFASGTGDWVLDYERLGNDIGGTSCYYASDTENIALLGYHIHDYDHNGTDDLVVASLDRYRDETLSESAKDRQEMGILSLKLSLYLMNSDGSLAHTFYYRPQINPYKLEQIRITFAEEWIFVTTSRDDDTLSSDEARDYHDSHDESLTLICPWGDGDENSRWLHYDHERKMGHLAIPEASNLLISTFSPGMDEWEDLYHEGATGVTFSDQFHQPYDPPLITNETYGTYASEDEAIEYIRSSIQDITGMDNFSLNCTTWENRWDAPFFQLKGSYPSLELELTSTNTYGFGMSGTTTIHMAQNTMEQ